MSRFIQFFGILIIAFGLSGCLYIDASHPLDKNMNETPIGTKVGKADCYTVLWAVGWGDCGTHAAALNGGIERIHNADWHTRAFLLGVFINQTTIVYGD